jgi:hypothetical protein
LPDRFNWESERNCIRFDYKSVKNDENNYLVLLKINQDLYEWSKALPNNE